MKDKFKEIREDVMDEQKAIEESIERMLKLRSDFDPDKEEIKNTLSRFWARVEEK